MLDASGRCVIIDWGMVIRLPTPENSTTPHGTPVAADAPVEAPVLRTRPVRLCNCVGWPCKCGKPGCAAPEMLGSAIEINARQPGFDPYKTDAWACDVILFSLLTGKQPWSWNQKYLDPAQTLWGPLGAEFAYVQEGRLTEVIEHYRQLSDFEPLSANAWAALNGLLQPDPDQRISVLEARQMAWFQ